MSLSSRSETPLRWAGRAARPQAAIGPLGTPAGPGLRGERTDRPAHGGFTLIELVVVMAIIAILAAMLLPALVRAKAKAEGKQSMNHHGQLLPAWRLYVDDNNETLPFVKHGPLEWGGGWLDFDAGNRENWDVGANVTNSMLWPYCGKIAAIFKCPGDRSTVNVRGKTLPACGPCPC